MTLDYDSAARSITERGYALIKAAETLMPIAAEIFHEGHGFFAQDDPRKLAAASPARLEGYRPLGSEFSNSIDELDLCEFFSVWAWNQTRPEVAAWARENGFHAVMAAALPAFAEVANGVIEAVRLRLNPEGDRVDGSRASYLQVNHYRPRDFTREFLQEAHEDGHILTVHKSTGHGLDLLISGRYEAVTAAADEFLLLPGSLLSLLSGGEIPPLFHRVRNDRTSRAREALLYFVNPPLDRETRPWIENASNRDISVRAVALPCLGAR